MSDAMSTLRIAFFGESESGKTALVSSYFGFQQRHAFEVEHSYRMVAADTRQGTLLLRNYYGMRDGSFPEATVSRGNVYSFDLKVSGLSRSAFRVEWIDYPGGWWQQGLLDPEEQQRQRDCIHTLLQAQVGFLLIDGERYRNEKTAYLRGVLRRFADTVRRWQDVLLNQNNVHLTVIEEWGIALTKADRFEPTYSAEKFGRDIIIQAAEELNELGTALYGTPRRFGTRFLLLSAAQVEERNPKQIRDVTRTIGLELIAPAALLSFTTRLAQDRTAYDPGAGLPWWQQALLNLDRIIREGRLERVVNKRYQPLVHLLRAVGALVNFDAEQRAEDMRASREQAVREGDALRAAGLIMQEELARAAERVFFVSQE